MHRRPSATQFLGRWAEQIKEHPFQAESLRDELIDHLSRGGLVAARGGGETPRRGG